MQDLSVDFMLAYTGKASMLAALVGFVSRSVRTRDITNKDVLRTHYDLEKHPESFPASDIKIQPLTFATLLPNVRSLSGTLGILNSEF